MKSRYFVIAAAVILVVAAAAVLRKSPEIAPAAKPTTTTATADDMSLMTATDPTLVFQKAFWRSPASDDQILHAERREWSAEDGVKKWQWFIAVKPGPQLLAWLKSNPFSLAPLKSAPTFEKPPAWFPKTSTDFQFQQNTEARLTLMLSADQKQLYATDSGFGFGPPITIP
jgi:hypothetical protein